MRQKECVKMSSARARTKQQSVKTPMKSKKEDKMEVQPSKLTAAAKATKSQTVSRKERKMALQQDVDKLEKKLRLEENIHRALERAFNRPLGTLPRLPPYLPPATLALLAEVAVLEEEIVRLEEQVVHFRQGLYQEAVYTASCKRSIETDADSSSQCVIKSPKVKQQKCKAEAASNFVTSSLKNLPHHSDNGRGIENELSAKSKKHDKGHGSHKTRAIRTPVKVQHIDHKSVEKSVDSQKSQMELKVKDRQNTEAKPTNTLDENLPRNDSANKISEDIIKCLSTIFLRMSSTNTQDSAAHSPSTLRLASQNANDKKDIRDPYGICSRFGERDIGPYKHLCSIESGSMNPNRKSNSMFLIRRLKLLLRRLASVNLQGLSHQEKLAFWINIYNSCMMNAFLEHGIPKCPEMVVELMQKATINVGGHLLNAITIEHFILRLPYHSKYTFAKGAGKEEIKIRSIFGLELSEPLVTFALSCGSWSSPAVRVYTASQVENELEVAKREYLQAAVGISTKTFAIPKLLDWYLLDFAKDFESLLDWICLQLPNELGKEAIKSLETGKVEPSSQFVQILPYEFQFRYLLHT